MNEMLAAITKAAEEHRHSMAPWRWSESVKDTIATTCRYCGAHACYWTKLQQSGGEALTTECLHPQPHPRPLHNIVLCGGDVPLSETRER